MNSSNDLTVVLPNGVVFTGSIETINQMYALWKD